MILVTLLFICCYDQISILNMVRVPKLKVKVYRKSKARVSTYSEHFVFDTFFYLANVSMHINGLLLLRLYHVLFLLSSLMSNINFQH